MKLLISFLRITALVVIAFLLIEYLLPVEDGLVMVKYPALLGILAVVLLAALAIEIAIAALGNVLFKSLNEDAREKHLQDKLLKKEKLWDWFKKLKSNLTKRKPIEEEGEIIMDHDYDGIRELDNKLPPWWIYGFYATIIWAFGYMAYYHIFDGTTQAEEYQAEMAQARVEIEEYKKNAPDLIDASTVALLTDEADLSAGSKIYNVNCVACHRADGGGGIGPNLTDDYWIVDGDIAGVYTVISEGGRPGKGMISWKQDLKPSEIAQVASYILSLHGSNPPDPKEAEGEFFVIDPE
ncbi:MAG: cbb3-type cytochrome c oxidase N-terminal domain-containing protein [Bacteroidota bacterium]